MIHLAPQAARVTTKAAAAASRTTCIPSSPLDLGFRHQVSPVSELGREACSELFGCVAASQEADLLELLLHLGGCEDRDGLVAQLVDDGFWRSGWHKDAGERIGLLSADAGFRHRWNIRPYRRALRAGHSDR